MLSIAALLKLFKARALFVFDPAAMQSILVKDQNIYEEHKDFISSVIFTPFTVILLTVYLRVNSLVFGPGIASTEGDHHRKFRKIMIPAFSTANLRRMVPMFYEVVQRVCQLVSHRLLHLNLPAGSRWSYSTLRS
jgi:cytochrome P450